MPWIVDDCSPLVANCVSVKLRDFCLDRDTINGLAGRLFLRNADGALLCDPNGSFLVNLPQIEEYNQQSLEECTDDAGCAVQVLKTCPLWANTDSDHDPLDPASVSRALPLDGTYYELDLNAGGVRFKFQFRLDAAVDYTDDCECINIKDVIIDGSVPPADPTADPFVSAVKTAIGEGFVSQGDLPNDGTIQLLGLGANGECGIYNLNLDFCELLKTIATTDVALAGTTQSLSVIYDANGVPTTCGFQEFPVIEPIECTDDDKIALLGEITG